MIIRILKIKLTKKQESTLESWLWNLTGVWNWAVKKIEHDARDGVYYSGFEFVNILANHSKKMEIPSHTLQGILKQAHDAWGRCFKKLAKKPRLKGKRNKLTSIPFPDPIGIPVENKISILGLGKVKYHKQELPDAKIKCGRIIKKASGWYLYLWLDTNHKFKVKDTDNAVGIDPGFSTLLTLSDGTKIENPRELRKGEERLAQSQRGKRKQLTSRLQEKQANRRTDRNHKISRWLVENYATICYPDDHFKGMARKLGKSVSEASLGNLMDMIVYKGSNCGRRIIPVSSVDTTKTCSTCGALTGPTGLAGLSVRNWECSVCGTVHDRDLNSSRVILNSGLGINLKVSSDGLN